MHNSQVKSIHLLKAENNSLVTEFKKMHLCTCTSSADGVFKAGCDEGIQVLVKDEPKCLNELN